MDDTRDKVIALEVRVEQLSESVDRLTVAVEQMTRLFDQARGAKWAVGLLLLAAGAVSTYLPAALKVLIGRA